MTTAGTGSSGRISMVSEDASSGTLVICPSPIGNLGDITLRVLEELNKADLILAEDTRRTLKLLNHFKIKKPLRSFNLTNERKALSAAVAQLQAGKRVALVSDAGTPAIADPGYLLVKEARSKGITVLSLPGPNAIITALAGSGLASESFIFKGFLPRQKGQLRASLQELAALNETSVLYESPRRLKKLLTEIADIMPGSRVAVVKELTKVHEDFIFGTAAGILKNLPEKPLGEYVVLIERSQTGDQDTAELRSQKAAGFLAGLDPSLSAKEKRDILVKEFGLKKNEAYDIALKHQLKS